MSDADLGPVIERARATQQWWGALSPRARRRHLLEARRQVARRADDLAALASEETGKSIVDALFEVVAVCSMTGWAARHAPGALAPRPISAGPIVLKRAQVRYHPLGVIGVIGPFNYPIGIPGQSLPFALAAGNTVVFKPSEVTPRTGEALAECFEVEGRRLVETVTGDGAVGAALVTSGIDKLVFTGSGRTASKILAAAADVLLPVVMELGGKDSMIVCSDADIDAAARTAVGAAFANAGQTCMATQRVLVAQSCYEELLERVLTHTRALRLGSGPEDHVGPVTQPTQIAIVEARIAAAVAAGARVHLGGQRIGDSAFAPTVVTDVPDDADLLIEENFAPILCIVGVAGDDEAIRLTNASSYGLNGSVFTRRRRRARRIVDALSTGGVNVNDAMIGAAIPGLPFGGVKHSGFGRLQGVEGLREMSRAISVVEPRLMRAPALTGLMFTGSRPRPATIQRLIRRFYGR